MLGSKWWGAFLWLAILLNISSVILNLILGHLIWVFIAVAALIWLAWSYKWYRLEREALLRARAQMEADDVA